MRPHVDPLARARRTASVCRSRQGFACRIPARNLPDSRRCHSSGVRVAIVAESFLPNVNGVTNSVLRVIEHLRRTGHEVLVIAPDTPRGEPPADRVHDGVRVHRVPSRMFPKVTSLPLGVPRPRMVGVLRGFDPDVVHLASPALLGYGGLLAARHLDVPTVAVFQTDVAGFAESYGVGVMSRAAWAWTRHLHGKADRTLAPSTSAMERPCRASRSARAPLGSRRRRHRLRPVGARRRAAGRVVAGRQADRRLRRPAGTGEARRAARGAGRARRPSAGDRRRRRRPRQARNPDAVSGFHRCAVRPGTGGRLRQHGRIRPSRRARDVLPGRAGGDGVGGAGRSRRMPAARETW